MGSLPFEREERETLVKREAETGEKFGTYPYDRPLERALEYGVVNLDKPSGPTSHQVSAYVQDILNIEKAGHSGTLDPKVTGVLPVALGRGTRITNALLTAGKEYVALMHLHGEVSQEEILELMEEFRGEIEQLQPVRSAVKREKRKREIYYIDILDIKENDVLFKVGSQAGTYIRKLCHDMGEELGVGAHMAELRRTKVGPFQEDSLTTLQDLTDAHHLWKDEGKEAPLKKQIQPVERGMDHLPKVWILDTAVDPLCHGSSLKIPGISKLHSNIQEGDKVGVMTLKNELVEIGVAQKSSEEMLEKEKGIAVKPDQVFMRPDTYPRYEK